MVRWLGIRARTTRRADVSARRAPAEEGGATQAFARAEARLPPPPARRRMTHGTRRAAAHREQCYALCIWGAGEGSRSATLLLSRSLRPRSAAGQALEGARGRGEHPGLAATLPTPQRRPSWMRRSFHSHHHPGLEGSVLLVCLEPRPITVRPALCVAPPARAPTARPPKRDPSFSRGCMLSPRTTHQSALLADCRYVCGVPQACLRTTPRRGLPRPRDAGSSSSFGVVPSRCLVIVVARRRVCGDGPPRPPPAHGHASLFDRMGLCTQTHREFTRSRCRRRRAARGRGAPLPRQRRRVEVAGGAGGVCAALWCTSDAPRRACRCRACGRCLRWRW